MKYMKLLISLFLLFNIFLSCRKFVEADPPIDKLNSDIIFRDIETATSAIAGLYANMMVTTPVLTSGGITIYTGLASDELYNSNVINPTQSEFASNTVSPANGIIQDNFWARGFNLVYHANACIESLNNNTYLPLPIREQLLGESFLCRAFIYYYFVNLFGDVPLLLTTDYIKNQNAPRTASVTVYEQIITDLKNAQALLSTSYPTDERVRPNKWAATALLARVYLTLGQWTLAEQESSSIINSTDYSLESDPNDVFLASSNEAIWQLMPVSYGYNTTEGAIFIPGSWYSGAPNFSLTNSLLSSFETGDLRKSSWVTEKIVQGQSYYYPFKYKIGNNGMPLHEYYIVFRLAEQYLIRAESLVHMGKIGEAKNDLNIIRERAGLPISTSSTSIDLISEISNERRVELFAEWGHRWFDLKRTKKSTEVLAPIKPDWQVTDTIFPIPLGEILRNPVLTQNPGYQ